MITATDAVERPAPWVNSGLNSNVDEALRICLNEFGMIAAITNAVRACEWINEDDHADPTNWLPWLETLY